MKRLPLLAILLFISASVFSQTQTEKEVKDLLVHKWKLTHIEMDGKKEPVPAEFGDSFLDFKADGSLIETDMTGEQKAKWTYDHKIKTITSEDKDGKEKYVIVKISATELVIKATEEGMSMTMTLKKV